MGSLLLPAPQDAFEPSRRQLLLGNSVLYRVDLTSSGLCVLPARFGCAVDQKKTVACCGHWEEHLRKEKFPRDFGRRRSHNPKLRLKHDAPWGLHRIDDHQTATIPGNKLPSSRVCCSPLLVASSTQQSSRPGDADLDNMRLKTSAYRGNRTNLLKRFVGIKRPGHDKASRPVPAKERNELECTRNDVELDAALSTINPGSSMEQCNSVLKHLHRRNDLKVLSFFEWMKSNGKLKNNANAYRLIFRALARKEDWDTSKLLLQEMISLSECELDAAVFNVLIYVCAKRGLVGWGTRWFEMMLERGVQPNIATIGMLMSMYQKHGNLFQAENTFAHMRSCGIKCISAYSAMITIYTRLGLFAKSEEIIHLMEKDEMLPNLENWLVRLNAYSQQGRLEEAKTILKSMTEAGVSENIVAYNTLITGYGKVSDMKAAKDLFESLPGTGLVPDETTYRSMLEGFGRAGSYKEALFYYKELKRSGFQPNSSNFYTMINLQARHDDEEGTIQTLKDMRVAGCQYSSILSSLIQAYERIGRLEKVLSILQASFYENILVDPTSCSILVMACIQNSLVEDAIRVLRDTKWEDFDFEDNLYHLLICWCKELGHYEAAVKIFSQMPKSDLKQNLHITSSMIDVFSSLDRFEDAETLYLKYKASGTFDMIGYSIVVRMYIKAARLNDACLVLDMLEKQKDIVPDAYLFRDMLRTYQRCGMLEKLANTYYWILRSGIHWDEAMYNCVINCCGRALPVDELSRLFNEMIQQGLSASCITFNVMLDIYGKAGLLKKAWKIFQMARKQGLVDIISYNTIIAAYARSKDFKSMNSVVQRMLDAGYPVSLEAYNCMLDAYGKEDQLEEFKEVLEKMKKVRSDFDHYTYNIMINIYGKRGWIEEVANVLTELRNHGLEPDLYSYNTLIKAYGVAGMAEEAVNVLQEMRSKRINPDRVTYTNLITALQRNENFLEAVKWSLWMKQMGYARRK